ncbi:MAG: metalloregulator ArsR/SmtB family transcription factor [Mycobacteriales bacterium]
MSAAPSGIDVVGALRALGEPHRLALLQALRLQERCVRDLVAAVGLSQPLVSHHLGRLAAAGLVTSRYAHGFTHYALDAGGLAALDEAVGALLDVRNLPASAHPGGNDRCCR